MFVNAIEEVARFTRPIHTITRSYGETMPIPGAATFFFVNELGVAITCRHVMELVGNRPSINERYRNFTHELAAIGRNNRYNQRVKALEEAYQYQEQSIIQLQELFIGVTGEKSFQYRWINHPQYDLSIVIFENFKNPLYQSHARFIKDDNAIKQGKFLCRLGFPFPEFTNYQYAAAADEIQWTNTGQVETPRFPIEGMVTRHLRNEGTIFGIELSTPGLRGQSGGPLFDSEGIIYGMQSVTNHLHLGFDMKNFEYKTGGRVIKVNNQPFIHVGHCLHAAIIKDFLRKNNIVFYEA